MSNFVRNTDTPETYLLLNDSITEPTGFGQAFRGTLFGAVTEGGRTIQTEHGRLSIIYPEGRVRLDDGTHMRIWMSNNHFFGLKETEAPQNI